MYKIENKEELILSSGAGVGQARGQSHELGLSVSRLMIMGGRGGKRGWSIPGRGKTYQQSLY